MLRGLGLAFLHGDTKIQKIQKKEHTRVELKDSSAFFDSNGGLSRGSPRGERKNEQHAGRSAHAEQVRMTEGDGPSERKEYTNVVRENGKGRPKITTKARRERSQTHLLERKTQTQFTTEVHFSFAVGFFLLIQDAQLEWRVAGETDNL